MRGCALTPTSRAGRTHRARHNPREEYETRARSVPGAHDSSAPARRPFTASPPKSGRGRDTRGVIRENFREYLDHLLRDGYSVRHDEHGSDPDLIDPGGNPVETWREDYPYDERLDRDVYEEEKYQLQIELLKFQYWTQDTGDQARDPVRGPRRRRQGRHDQAVHGAPQPARRPGRRADQADRDRARPVVLPPLRHPPADRRRDRAVRPVLVQPRRRRAGDGLLHRPRVRASSCGRPRCSRRCWSRAASR